MVRELPAEELAWSCPDDWLPWRTSADIEPAASIVGQDRAVRAIAFGLGVGGTGYNIFVTGLSGTGRLTTIKRFLDEQTEGQEPADDVCFVFNFRSEEEPRVLRLKAGAGRRLREAMDRLITELAESLSEMFTNQEIRDRIDAALADLKGEEKELVGSFEHEVQEAGFQMVQIKMGMVTRPEIFPVVKEKPVPMDELSSHVEAGDLSAEEASGLEKSHELLMKKMGEVFQRVTELRRQMEEQVEKVQKAVVRPLLDVVVRRVGEATGDDRVNDYLREVRTDLEERLAAFAGDEKPEGVDPFLRWRVNLAVDNGELKGRPVVIETEPTFTNLFGTIERSLTSKGEGTSSFLKIRAGSLLRASGGYLVLSANDVLLEARAWPGLKRALKYSRVQIQSPESAVLGISLLKPEAVPLEVKVVIIGDRSIYDLLYRLDPDFPKIFKVLADFDSLMPLRPEAAHDILSVLRKVSADEDLPAMEQSGMAAILEVAVRLGRYRHRFSSRFSDLADVLREASFLARKAGSETVSREHVTGALAAHRYRHGLSEERTLDFIADEVIHINTEGTAVGQVSGLAVYDLGHHRFGKPARISARVGLGRDGVINIERQSGLSGPTYDKGVNILTGFLRGNFARRAPLTMACSVTFEQSYGGVDGDSASSTEIYAILSALAELPLRQDVAVTGSVDQYGRVQPIGGVNEKIEAFYRVCSRRGLSGSQGVMIPSGNVKDLHLDGEVLKAVREGSFHVWEVGSIEEGIELLTGTTAGEWQDDGWPAGSVYARCQERLDEMARLMRRAGKAATDDTDGNGAS
ncbi:MAG: AAA family ATPase [Acidobacteria bacterium]|nr:AAA family ATPase [Acidobacteriota bacterium]